MFYIHVSINCIKEEIKTWLTAMFRYSILLKLSPVGIRRTENILYRPALLAPKAARHDFMNIWGLSQNSEPGFRIRFLCSSAWPAACFIRKVLLCSWGVDIWCSVHRRHTLSFFTHALSWNAVHPPWRKRRNSVLPQAHAFTWYMTCCNIQFLLWQRLPLINWQVAA